MGCENGNFYGFFLLCREKFVILQSENNRDVDPKNGYEMEVSVSVFFIGMG